MLKGLFANEEHAGMRLDQFLVAHLPGVSRARVQQLLEQGKVEVQNGSAKPSYRLRGGEKILVTGEVEKPPIKARAEEIELDVVYEDDDFAVINKPAGMVVHAGAGSEDHPSNRGTLVNALLHRFAQLSKHGGEMRPGIVHRLDKETSGLIIVAKNDVAHTKLARQFATRVVKKMYLALVHGWPKQETGTISAAVSRDRIRRTRMTTKGSGGRDAVSHYKVLRKIESKWGKFALLEVRIDTGRTHQIRVHLSSIGHPVVGDALYGAPRLLRGGKNEETETLGRNFLHATAIELEHPSSSTRLSFSRPLPAELESFLQQL
jgi:23S rRNA pseudouridine1911/1915/1917 synthase